MRVDILFNKSTSDSDILASAEGRKQKCRQCCCTHCWNGTIYIVALLEKQGSPPSKLIVCKEGILRRCLFPSLQGKLLWPIQSYPVSSYHTSCHISRYHIFFISVTPESSFFFVAPKTILFFSFFGNPGTPVSEKEKILFRCNQNQEISGVSFELKPIRNW